MTNLPPRGARPVRSEAATHSFAVGQAVRLKGPGGQGSRDNFRITGIVPPRGDQLQYRIRNDEERHERLATEVSLEPMRASAEGLAERTFASPSSHPAVDSAAPANDEASHVSARLKQRVGATHSGARSHSLTPIKDEQAP